MENARTSQESHKKVKRIETTAINYEKYIDMDIQIHPYQ